VGVDGDRRLVLLVLGERRRWAAGADPGVVWGRRGHRSRHQRGNHNWYRRDSSHQILLARNCCKVTPPTPDITDAPAPDPEPNPAERSVANCRSRRWSQSPEI